MNITIPNVSTILSAVDRAMRYVGVVGLLFLVLHFGGCLSGKPVPTVPDILLPAQIIGEPGEPIAVVAKTAGKVLHWRLESGLKHVPNGPTGLYVWGKPGSYSVWCYTTVRGVATDTAETTVIIQGAAPEPSPADEFAVALQAAWKTETATDRVAKKNLLASFYSSVAVNTANDVSNDTAGKLLNALHNTAQAAIGDALPNVRKAIGAELSKTLPTAASDPLNDATRKVCVDQFTKLSTLLGELK